MEEQQEIIYLAEQVLEDQDLFLVDTELKGSVNHRVIWIYVESESGNVSVDHCAQLSRELQLLLDAHGWHERKYTLNVSSPGLDRPLKDFRQYVNNAGRNASVVFEKDGDETRIKGKLIEANPDRVVLKTENGRHVEIPFSDIVETRILVSFKQ